MLLAEKPKALADYLYFALLRGRLGIKKIIAAKIGLLREAGALNAKEFDRPRI